MEEERKRWRKSKDGGGGAKIAEEERRWWRKSEDGGGKGKMAEKGGRWRRKGWEIVEEGVGDRGGRSGGRSRRKRGIGDHGGRGGDWRS